VSERGLQIRGEMFGAVERLKEVRKWRVILVDGESFDFQPPTGAANQARHSVPTAAWCLSMFCTKI